MNCCEKNVERLGEVALHGNSLTLLGERLQAGDQAPDFALLKTDLSAVTLADFAGKTLLLSVAPSLDTPTCDLQAKRFNEEAAKRKNIAVLNISMDLPFALKRWCGANHADDIVALSAHRSRKFGVSYGVLIKELRLLARSVFVISPEGIVTYAQIVPEISNQPDYEEALAKLP